MIIVIEGGDATGKATQSKRLAERLGARLFSFPAYETTAGQAILGNLKEEWTCDSTGLDDSSPQQRGRINALVLQSLMLTNRMEMAAQILEAAKHGPVVLDRYAASAMVYGKLDGLDPAWIEATNAGLRVQPDLYILLDAPTEESFKRRPERRDRYEKDRAYLESVRIEYLRLFEERQQKRVEAMGSHAYLKPPGPIWRVVDAMGTIEEVSARIWETVQGGGNG